MRCRILAGILSVISVAFILTGCGKDTENTSSQSTEISRKITENETEEQASTDSSENTNVVITKPWTPPAGSRIDKDGYVYDESGCVIGSIQPYVYNPDTVG